MGTDIVSIESLRLTAEQQKAVGFLTEFSKQMVVMAFLEKNIPTSVSSLVKEIYRVYDDVMAGCLKNGAKLPCKKGCFWCCYMRVKVTPLEVLYIVDFLCSSLKPGNLSELRHRLVATDETTRGMDGYQRVCAKITCPLLVDGKCLAYPVRPIACRVYHSLNLSDCEASLDKVGDSVTIRHDISGLSMGIFAGLTEGLRTVGLQTRLLELIAGLRIAMDEPGSRLEKRWLSGEPAFVEAEIESTEKIESFHKLLVDELGEPLR